MDWFYQLAKAIRNGAAVAGNTRLDSIEKRLHVLECPHSEIEFGYNLWDIFSSGYSKKCKSCGKVLDTYPSEIEYLEAKIEHEEESVKQNKMKVAALRKAMKATTT